MLISLLCLFLVGVSPILGTSIASISRPYASAGVVIGKRYLLFSPTGLEAIPLEEHEVRVGSIKDYLGGKTFNITGYIAHPNYTPSPSIAKGRTGKDNKDNIAVVIVSEDLPIGHDDVDQANLPSDININTVGPAEVLTWTYTPGQDYLRSNIVIHSKAECEANHSDIDCTRNLWATASNTCDIREGSPVFSGNTLIGTIATSRWCRVGGDKHLFINSLPHYKKWIERTIADQDMLFANNH